MPEDRDASDDPGVVIPAPSDATIEAGASILSNSVAHGAGDIALYTGHDITVAGTVEARGFTTGGHGGAITLDACCSLLITDTGVVNSQGQDPGADRVHLEACIVTVYGLVQSSAPAHAAATPNCSAPDRPFHVPPVGHFNSACIEIWSGTTLTIDATPPHHAEVNADVGFSGGIAGHSWIDILANGAIILRDGTGNDGANPKIPSPPTDYLVHANMGLGNGIGGDILVQSKSSNVSTFSFALQANDTTNGGHGGTVTVQAGGAGSPAGDVAFGTALVQAQGPPAAARRAAAHRGAPSAASPDPRRDR
jgi:hypothetical protein